MQYEAYLASDSWKKKRAARLRLDGFRCRLCDCAEDLEVHHRPSSYRRIPNESVSDDLIALCITCHQFVTNRIRGQRYAATRIPLLVAEGPYMAEKPEQESLSFPNIPSTNQGHATRSLKHVMERNSVEVPRLSAVGNA
jgi:hypothetical protein